MVAKPNSGRAPALSIEGLLACPVCTAALDISSRVVRCLGCEAVFPRTRTDCYELLPPEHNGDARAWRERQGAMEAWYQDMVTTDWARACFDNDYEPLRPFLSRYSGTILDLGGGAGVTRRYLPADAQYLSLDPSLMWLRDEWAAFASPSERIGQCAFVQGAGERMPVASGTIDAVLSLWSMNHVSDPARVFDEVRRVLRPGGSFLVVLEDVEPRWSDLPKRWRLRGGWRSAAADVVEKLRASLPGGEWKLQPDHIRITEADLRLWAGMGFVPERRTWIADYLTVEYARTERDA